MSDSRAIGVFDSGLGGLTVLKALMKHLPGEDFVYLGDTARLPYGTKSGSTIRKYTEQNLKFLKSQNVQALVIACNSASAHWQSHDFEGLPVFTVIEPASQLAVEKSENKKIGLLATRATVNSRAFDQFIHQLDPQAQLYSQAAPLLVPLAEEGLVDDPLTNLIVFRYTQGLKAQEVDTVILGCTHYPILRTSIQKAFGHEVNLIESGDAVAEQLKAYLQSQKKPEASQNSQVRIFTTDSLGSFKKWAEEILLPDQVQSWELTDLQ